MTNRKFTHPDDAPEGHKWQTRDGRAVTWIKAFDLDSPQKSIVGVVDNETIIKWFATGDYLDGDTSGNDIFDVVEERTVWINIYDTDVFSLHSSRELADDSATSDRVACIKVTYTEGQFDD